ncbi:MAG: FIG004851: hypothetical protein [uncultured Microvirga sp.]|uniref:DUF1178 family protein n=1 Tax=uncultured Microvirga sp. TaxID=412392 RepID=A0A6J4MHE3_9HYPH|nr:MAG: FIG004851: hypothetical protein [uncultured Microvirga sp.]
MIRYALACENGHEFESWFPSSDAFEAQAARGLVACPVCNVAKVEKQIMRPSVSRSGASPRAAPDAPAEVPAPQPPQPVAVFSERERELRAMVTAIREHVMKNAENVGERFPDQARKMHHGEIEHRSIYGAASPVEVKELLEEGVELHPLPMLPGDRN